MEQNENDRSPDDPPATGSGLFYRDGREIPPTHPDHGPMHLLPRQEDGSFAAYYYCSKAELYDMQVPAPPPRRYRKDGFSPERQEQFLEYVRGGASGREAARRVGISPTTAYNLYNSPDGAAFRSGWDEAARVTDIVLEDTAFDRAVNGQEEIVYHQGQRVGTRWKYDNNLLMKLLRARLPLKYAPLSEIEGWLRHRGIAPPADVDGALDRLREAEAEWGSRLPGEEPSNRLANEGAAACPELPTSVRAEPVEVRSSCAEESKDEPPTGSARTDAGFEDPSCPSMSSTSPGTGPAEDPAAASTSSTSPGTGQEDSGSSMSSSSSGPGRQAVESGGRAKPPDPDDGSIPYYRPPPGPRSLSASSRTRTATTASARR
ncbi:MAG TPA: hypothetical protein VK403_01045 [Allosphingosinicella sp.]|nr:hypothetical protein [Allosphingosinicella sp.]